MIGGIRLLNGNQQERVYSNNDLVEVAKAE
jgi:hypothetical protein